ncbi:Cytochrome P450 family protein [Quillaja saponaria]|uniref:Cytochrome P450 family protein n=1 Tax=Quillaja saponaria TaxID=32244 RepID=A0AAD7M6T3_QUISA|nr:Cytochrome P450 family protein [Quillaja saponaria]
MKFHSTQNSIYQIYPSSPTMKFLAFLYNPNSLTVALVAVSLAVFVIKVHGRRVPDKRRYHPVAGTILNQLFHFNRLHDYMTDLTRKHTTYRLLSLFISEVYTANPVNVEYILKTNFLNYGKGLYHFNILTDLMGDGIFAVDGEKWRHQRKAASYEFSTKVLREFSSAVFKSNAIKLAEIVSEAAISNRTIEIQDLFMKSTLDSVFKIVLGVELDTMCGTYEEGTKFSKAFDEAVQLLCIDEFVYKLIRSKIEQVQKSQDDLPMKKGDILSRFLEVKETNPKYLKDIILSFKRLYKKSGKATNLRNSSTIDGIAASLSEEALDKMKYLHAALTETLRLYPAVPLDGKLCTSDDTLPDGFSVRKGDLVGYQPYAMGRMKFIWGDDAEVFRPERWLDKNGIFQQESPFKFTAFQAGPRICLGKEFAYRQMKIFCAVLLGSHKFKLADQKKPVNYRTMLTLHIDGGLHLHASQRLKESKFQDTMNVS